MSVLAFPSSLTQALRGADAVLLLLPAGLAEKGWVGKSLHAPWADTVARALRGKESGPGGRTISLANPGAGPSKIVVGLLPERVSRHNAPARTEAVAAAAAAADLFGQPTAVIAALDDPAHALPVARATLRGAPLYTRQTVVEGKRRVTKKPARLSFLALDAQGKTVPIDLAGRALLERTRWAARLVDMPTSELTTAAFEKAVRKASQGLAHVKVTSIRGDDLLEHGLGGIHAVGRAAEVAPRLVVVHYKPPKAKRRIALVGKGVVYDTGGLSLKPSASMFGMKKDMAGAAVAVAAALAMAEGKAREEVIAVAPLAENAIGPGAYRPDDILIMHSGKTVEVNNTDAEGRLLLGDAVSWVARKYHPDVVIDAATLTGAQLISTGLRHAAIVSNREGLERLAIAVGRRTGDLVHPLPFAPEFFQDEFRSKVADMRNSVANRMNAQTSCAAQFVYSHVQDLDVPWLHVDLAGPAGRDDRATGFGVHLLAEVATSVRPEDWKA